MLYIQQYEHADMVKEEKDYKNKAIYSAEGDKTFRI